MRIFTADRKLTPSWQLVQPSIDLVKKYIWHVLYLGFLPGLLTVVALTLFGGIDGRTETITALEPRYVFGAVLLIISAIWSLIAMPAFVYLQLQAIEDKMPSIMECYRKGLKHLLPMIGMYILSAVLIICGFIALVIPGFLLIRGFLLSPYYLVDKNLSPVEALRQSYRESRSVSLYIWGIIGVTFAFAIMGTFLGILPVIGSLLSLAIGYIYIFGEPLRYMEVAKNKLVKQARVD